MKNKFLRLLAIMGALWSVTPKAAGAEAKENDKVDANVGVFAPGGGLEVVGDVEGEGGVTAGDALQYCGL